ncbi:MAG: D-glycerate dehydrogenase [Chloroflexi bacterium]|nr:D-glycerate dehydrogenase [Chloroflexota bacterium]
MPTGRRSRPNHVFVTRDLPGDGLRRLRDEANVDLWGEDLPPSREALLEGVREADGLICLLTDNIDAGLFDHAERLKVVSTMAVGYDHIDVDAATSHNVLVTNTPGVLTETTADLAFALLLAAARRLPESERAIREGRWTTWSPAFLLGRDISGATLGIVGLGEIGQAVARRAHGFGMRILHASLTPKPEVERELGCSPVTFDELLAQSDFVTVHVPLTPQTRHMFDAQAFDRMKETAIFVNTSRGAVVVEADLQRALESKSIAAAAIDVAETEPVAPRDPMLRLPNLLVTPHIGSASVATRARMADMAIDNLLAALDGKRPANCVNPQVWAGRPITSDGSTA